MPFALGAILFLVLLLVLQGSGKRKGKEGATHVLLGSLVVGAVVLVSLRAGMSWLGIATALLWMAWQRFRPRGYASPGGGDASPGGRPGRRAGRMTRDEALEVLGLTAGATPADVLAQYRRLMKKVHPDLGGTTYLATRLNEAKDILLDEG